MNKPVDKAMRMLCSGENMMKDRTVLLKISFSAALLMLLLAVFTLFQGLLPIVFAPFSLIGGNFLPDDDPNAYPNATAPGYPETPIVIPTPTPTRDPWNPDYILLRMSQADISRGTLVLVNNTHSYESPDEYDLISIADLGSPSYSLITPGAMISSMAIDALNDMMDAFYAETGNSSMAIRSAYRSRVGQQQVYEHYVRLVGRVEAQKWAALPGHSEHHTGLAVDLGRIANDEVYVFTGAGIYSWFSENSYRFGFILRYPPDKTEITQINYEPWHFRYVGNPHAYIMQQSNRSLEEYIEMLMNHTTENPFTAMYDGVYSEIYFTTDTEIRLPYNRDFDVSGNNINGFIVTIMQQTDTLSGTLR